jgi:transcriptional regulator with XRE-family HTH domain
MENDLNRALAETLRSMRLSRGWTLDRFAEASGVSRAMISKVERCEVSPTAAILARLAAGLQTSLASLFAAEPGAHENLCRWEDRQDWTDPESGYVRRNVSPAGATADIVYVSFPAKARVVFDNHRRSEGIEQQVWVLEGEMELTVGGRPQRLSVGDCLTMSLDEPIVFHNPGDVAARYVVVLSRRSP